MQLVMLYVKGNQKGSIVVMIMMQMMIMMILIIIDVFDHANHNDDVMLINVSSPCY